MNLHLILRKYSTHSPILRTASFSAQSIDVFLLTSILVGLGIRGILNLRKLGVQDTGPKLPYLALINLGFASSLFHSSLKYSTQMYDEFSMLIATFIVFYRLLSFSQTRFSPKVLLYSLLALMGTVMMAQFLTGESTVQQVVFTGMVYWLWNTCFKLISKLEQNDQLKSKMRWMALSGIGKVFDV